MPVTGYTDSSDASPASPPADNVAAKNEAERAKRENKVSGLPKDKSAIPDNFLSAINDLKTSTDIFSNNIKFFANAAKDIQDRSNRYNRLIDSTIALQESSKAQNARLVQNIQTLQGRTLEVISQSTLRSLNTIIDKNNKFILDQDKKRAPENKTLEALFKQQKSSTTSQQSTGSGKVKDWFFNSTVEGDFIKSMVDAFSKKIDTASTDTDSDQDTETAAEALRVPGLQPVKVMEYGDEALRQLCKLFKNCINLKPEKKPGDDCVELCDPCPDCSSKLPGMLPALMKVATAAAAAAAVTAAVAVATSNTRTAKNEATEEEKQSEEKRLEEEKRLAKEAEVRILKAKQKTEPFATPDEGLKTEVPVELPLVKTVTPVTTSLPAVPAVTPAVTPVVTPAVTPAVTPVVTPVVTPAVTPVVTPAPAPGTTLPVIPVGPTVKPPSGPKPFLTPPTEWYPLRPLRETAPPLRITPQPVEAVAKPGGSPLRTIAQNAPRPRYGSMAVARPATVAQGGSFGLNLPTDFGYGYVEGVDAPPPSGGSGGGGRPPSGGSGGAPEGWGTDDFGESFEFENENNWRGLTKEQLRAAEARALARAKLQPKSPDRIRFQDDTLYPTAEGALTGQPPPSTLGQIGGNFVKNAAKQFTPTNMVNNAKQIFNPPGGFGTTLEELNNAIDANEKFRINNLARGNGGRVIKLANAEYFKPGPGKLPGPGATDVAVPSKLQRFSNLAGRTAGTAAKVAAPTATVGAVALFAYHHAKIDEDLKSGKIDMLEARKQHTVINVSSAAAAAGGLIGATAAGFLSGLITLPMGATIIGLPPAVAAEGLAILTGGIVGGTIAQSLVSGPTRKWVDANLKEEDQKVETGKPAFTRMKERGYGTSGDIMYVPPSYENASDYKEDVTYTKDQYGQTVVIPEELAGDDKKKERDVFVQKSVELFKAKASKNPDLYKNAPGASRFEVYSKEDPKKPVSAFRPGALDYRTELKNDNNNTASPSKTLDGSNINAVPIDPAVSLNPPETTDNGEAIIATQGLNKRLDRLINVLESKDKEQTGGDTNMASSNTTTINNNNTGGSSSPRDYPYESRNLTRIANQQNRLNV